MYRETVHAISRFHSVLGVRERNIGIAPLTDAYGMHTPGMILLDKEHFSQSRQAIEENQRSEYASGFKTETNQPIAHTITHELGHALWRSDNPQANNRAASKEIKRLYRDFMHDVKTPGYGKYATANVDEFWAEAVTKAVHGKQDKYTAAVKRIVRDYKL